MVSDSSTMAKLTENAQAVLSDILHANKPKLGAFFNSCMDTDTRNKLGVTPLQADLDAILNATSNVDVLVVAASLATKGVPGFLQLFALNIKYYAQSTSMTFEPAVATDVAQVTQDAVLQWDVAVSEVQNVNGTAIPSTLFEATQGYSLSIGTFAHAVGLDARPNNPSDAIVLIAAAAFEPLEDLLQISFMVKHLLNFSAVVAIAATSHLVRSHYSRHITSQTAGEPGEKRPRPRGFSQPNYESVDKRVAAGRTDGRQHRHRHVKVRPDSTKPMDMELHKACWKAIGREGPVTRGGKRFTHTIAKKPAHAIVMFASKCNAYCDVNHHIFVLDSSGSTEGDDLDMFRHADVADSMVKKGMG
ncbi:Aste57867_22825 [Aphanomyces stellatus]|uniref:Aste57867_22825 protein n=1 Tax=Aphanomyces stellatus TaxID=120398 RepID=A0A485LM73_9STRA|nr:hypothetical protein As57867_022755 [Aphanomyces stellatus]VFT99476.1 Aste57867_22825 [Aphanomyces stellatus]